MPQYIQNGAKCVFHIIYNLYKICPKNIGNIGNIGNGWVRTNYIRTYIRIYINVYTYIFLCIYVVIYIHTCMYVCMYIFIGTKKRSLKWAAGCRGTWWSRTGSACGPGPNNAGKRAFRFPCSSSCLSELLREPGPEAAHFCCKNTLATPDKAVSIGAVAGARLICPFQL